MYMTNDHSPHDLHDHEPLPEGEEEAPRFTHTMAIVRWIILIAISLFALVMILGYFNLTPWANDKAVATQYHCPMHPTYVSNQPGECPICGMSLVPIDKEGKEIPVGNPAGGSDSSPKSDQQMTAQPGQYTCPMHPEVISDTPGKCPKCGMDLEQVPAVARPGQYTCPMHPEVVSDTPGKCPKCGMDLELVKEKTGASAEQSQQTMANMGSAPVQGLVPVTIEPQRLQLIGVRTGVVARRSLSGSLRIVGFIAPDESRVANVHVRFSGWVKGLNVDQTGQLVKAGEKLLSVYSQDLYQAEQDFILTRDGAARVSGNGSSPETGGELVDASRQRLALLGVPADELARLETAAVPSLELPVLSPYSGYVLEKNVFDGQYIGPGQNLFTIADLSRVWVLAEVYENDLSRIQVGESVRMTTTAYPNESFEGSVAFIYPTVSEQTRTLRLRVEIANPSLRLRPGMYAEVELDGQGDAVLAVPSDAVMDDGTRQYAFAVRNGIHFEPRLLQTGRSSDDWIEIISGLAEGEQVVTSANFLIDSESRLKAAIAGMGATTDTNANEAMPAMPGM
jgi:Cu(I)/Ag(I) efflux system membrane fusion protein